MKNTITIITLVASLTTLVNGQTFVLNFDSTPNGQAIIAGDGTKDSGYDFENLQPYAGVFGNNQGVTFTSLSDNALTVYNTDFGGSDVDIVGRDYDLEPGYIGGNNVLKFGANHSFGNALIIQENGINIDSPDDDGKGGSYTIISDLALSTFEFDMLDINDPRNATLRFEDSATGEFVDVNLRDFEADSGSDFSVDNVEFGDRHSNNIDTVTIENLQGVNEKLTEFDTITFTTSTSGGLANIELTAVPEPSSSLLVGLGFLTFTLRRKR